MNTATIDSKRKPRDVMFNIEAMSNYEIRKKIKFDKQFKNTNKIWINGNYAASKNVGQMMKLINICKPNNRLEWQKYYLNYFQNNFGIPLFSNILFDFSKNANISIQKAFLYIYIRVIDQTYNGYISEKRAEQDLIAYFQKIDPSRKYIIKHSNDNADRNYSVDFIVYTMINGKVNIVYGVQMKPKSYFYYHKQNKELDYNIKHEKKFIKKYNAKVLYWSYEGLSQNNKPELIIN